MIRLERQIGIKKTVVEANPGEWVYWSWDPEGKEIKNEYVLVPMPRGMLFANRPDRSHPFYPFKLETNERGYGFGAGGAKERFYLTIPSLSTNAPAAQLLA